MSTQLRLETRPERLQGCARPYPCECRRCRPLNSRRTGTIQCRLLKLLEDGRQWTAPLLARELGEDGGTVARELRKLAGREPRLLRVARGGHSRAVWFMVGAER